MKALKKMVFVFFLAMVLSVVANAGEKLVDGTDVEKLTNENLVNTACDFSGRLISVLISKVEFIRASRATNILDTNRRDYLQANILRFNSDFEPLRKEMLKRNLTNWDMDSCNYWLNLTKQEQADAKDILTNPKKWAW